MTLKRSGNYSMPKQARRVDFTKYSALHANLVEKGYYWVLFENLHQT